MSRFHSYINTAIKIIDTYQGEKPFAVYLKQFFSADKKYGSKDRRQVSSLCYNYFRLGFAAGPVPPAEKIGIATFLCESAPSQLMYELYPQWNENIGLPIEEKSALTGNVFSLADIFPFSSELSDGIDPGEFCKSFLVQPGLFIRIRPQSITTVINSLEQSTFDWQRPDDHCVQLPGSVNVDSLFVIDKEVVVQDYNSQKVLDYLKQEDAFVHSIEGNRASGLSVWDCCTASGGKSILLHDIINREFALTVSDIRAGILQNLHARFKNAGITKYKHFIADIARPGFKPPGSGFDLIICDAPCTGSGTWSRTPEQLCFFKQSAIQAYSELQKKIVTNAIPYLQAGGLFVYITCSVFKQENEQVAEFIAKGFNCTLLHQELLKGYDKKADNMFVAVFKKQ